MRKAVTKRMKITKTGKLIHRRSGINHFNAKESRKTQRRKHQNLEFTALGERKTRQYMMQ